MKKNSSKKQYSKKQSTKSKNIVITNDPKDKLHAENKLDTNATKDTKKDEEVPIEDSDTEYALKIEDSDNVGGADEDTSNEEDESNEDGVSTKEKTKEDEEEEEEEIEEEEEEDEKEEEEDLSEYTDDSSKEGVVDEEDEDCLYKYAEDEEYEETDYVELRKEIVASDKRITKPFLTKYERVRLLGDRAKQISLGAKPLIKNATSLSSVQIAEEELKNNIIPMIIERPLPNGKIERWKINELQH